MHCYCATGAWAYWDIGVFVHRVLVHRSAELADDRMPEEPPPGGHGSGMWHPLGGAFNHAGLPSLTTGATRTRPRVACRPCSRSRPRLRLRNCCFCCCCPRRARAGRLACGSRTPRGSARAQTLARRWFQPRRPRRVAGRREVLQVNPLPWTTFARALWTRRSWGGSAMALPGPAKVPPWEVGWWF